MIVIVLISAFIQSSFQQQEDSQLSQMKFCDQVIDLFIDNNREYLNNELKNYEQQDHDKIVFHHFYYMMAKCYFYIQANGFPDEDVDWIAIIEPYNYFYQKAAYNFELNEQEQKVKSMMEYERQKIKDQQELENSLPFFEYLYRKITKSKLSMLIFGIIVFFSYVFFVTCRFIIVETISAVKEEEKRNYNKIGKGLKMGGIGGGIKQKLQ